MTFLEIDGGDCFGSRHIGPRAPEIQEMLASLGVAGFEELMAQTVPESIRLNKPLDLPDALSEHELLKRLEEIGSRNRIFRSYIGMGYHDTIVPGVILRNILENPGW